MRAELRRVAGVAAAAAALAYAPDAAAYCRTTTVASPEGYDPAFVGRCWTEGFPVFWRNRCVGYNIQADGSRRFAYDTVADAAASAFAKWSGTSCPGSGDERSRVSIDARDLGRVECGEVRYNKRGNNQNVIVFRDDAWPHADPSSTLGLTTVTFNPDTGEIFDADMEINTSPAVRLSASDDPGEQEDDLLSVIVHEAGHFLGLAHSESQRAVMFSGYTRGSTIKRELSDDDVSGICAIYRPNGDRPVLDGKVTPGAACDPTPRRGFSTGCEEPPPASSCGVGRGPAGGGGPAGALGLAAAAGVAFARRRLRRGSRR